MAIENRDIVELKNSIGVIVFPKTTGEAVFLTSGDDLQTFLNNLHNALTYDITPKETNQKSLGTSTKRFKQIYVGTVNADKVYANVQGNVTGDTSGTHTGNVNGNTSGTHTGNVNSAGTGYRVYGAVFN